VKYLCLAYGGESDWKALNEKEQNELLTQDEVIRERGALMAAVEPMLDCFAPLAHGLRILVEPPLHGLDHMLMLPPCDPALHACRAAALERAGPTRVGSAAAQRQPVFDVREVVFKLLKSIDDQRVCRNDGVCIARQSAQGRQVEVIGMAMRDDESVDAWQLFRIDPSLRAGDDRSVLEGVEENRIHQACRAIHFDEKRRMPPQGDPHRTAPNRSRQGS
jgi:hypothetical protein